ncbi:MAG: alpha/beta fold hydrolase [Planctomycetota bacterium]
MTGIPAITQRQRGFAIVAYAAVISVAGWCTRDARLWSQDCTSGNEGERLIRVSDETRMPTGSVFTLLKRITVAELNVILDKERTTFLASHKGSAEYKLPAGSTARNEIELYTVTYESKIPELGNRKIVATGLVAIPVLQSRQSLPSIIYEHGTAFGKYEVPSYAFQPTNPTGFSHYDGAYETRHIAALYGGNGYVVIAPDYFGMGGSAAEPEAYFVKASTQQASYDFYMEASAFVRSRGIETSHLFVSGWSQGGLNATGLIQKLEKEKIQVTAAFTASNPADPFTALNGLMYCPRVDVDAVWLNTIVALSVFAFETYYKEPGLAKSVLAADAYDDMRSIYERSYAGPGALGALLEKYSKRPLLDYFQPDYRDPAFFAQSRYGTLLQQSETLRQLFRTPIRTYYGTADEAIKEMVGTLVADYQRVLIGHPGALMQSRVEAVSVPGGNHRQTFISAASLARDWFDEIRRPQ